MSAQNERPRRDTTSPYAAGSNAAWRGESLDDVPAYYTDAQADEWERGWYTAMDDALTEDRAEARS